MNRGHAVLISDDCGLGRTTLVRLSAFLSKIKVYIPREYRKNLIYNFTKIIF